MNTLPTMGMKEIAPFGLRMPPALKARLVDLARKNGRSLNTEVLARLQATLAQELTLHHAAAEPAAPAYNVIDATEARMLAAFRQLTADKQLAVLSLLS